MTSINVSSGDIIYLSQHTNDFFYNINGTPNIQITSFPLSITNTNQTNYVTLFITTNLTITNSSIYIILQSNFILLDGQQKTINISSSNYNGFIQQTNTAYNNITIQNIIINGSGSLSNGSGWICQSGFAAGTINNCSSSGDISVNGGGICGSLTGSSGGIITITNCYSTGLIAMDGGGICGSQTGSNNGTVHISYCYSTGNIGNDAGGICGQYNGSNNGTVNISYCYSLGNIGNDAGGITGSYAGDTNGTVNINNCFSIGLIGQSAGGIYGEYAGHSFGFTYANSCYSIGSIGQYGGGIYGNNAGSNSNDLHIFANSCYSMGSIGQYGGGIFGNNADTARAIYCYSIGTIGSSTGGIYGPTIGSISANYCYTSGIIITNGGIFADNSDDNIIGSANNYSEGNNSNGGYWNDSNALILKTNNSYWFSTNINTPYLLSSYNASIYNPNIITGNTTNYVSNTGLFTPNFNYQIINTPTNITINNSTGSITFNNVDPTTYLLNILVSQGSSPAYYNYNYNTFTYEIILNICFPANTPILTDNGIINIENIDIHTTTINNKKIKYISKTYLTDNYLICLEKNSLGSNYPNQLTIISEKHKILFNGHMYMAITICNLINNAQKVYKIKYDNQPMYNILLEQYDTMMVNNLIVETLYPTMPFISNYNQKKIKKIHKIYC